MRGRKTSTAAKAKSSHKPTRPAKAKSGQSAKLKAALKKATETRKMLQKKLADTNAEWKSKIKHIEEQALEKARSHFEREHSKREDARKKVIDAATAKFDKQYSKTKVKKRRPAAKKAKTTTSKAKRSTSHSKKRAAAK